jgi:hypothetical protein
VGCGRGTWLKVCHDLGSTQLFGFDGNWNNQSLMIDSAIAFRSIDLNMPFTLPTKVDLAMSLEVAEHLEAAASPGFVKCLTDASDIVLFSAAYSGQGGVNHINEQPHTYWARLFAAEGFAPYDLFRPAFWGNNDVCFWYRQNAFLYIKNGSEAARRIASFGFREMADISFMDCIHPQLYNYKAAQAEMRLRRRLAAISPDFVKVLGRRLLRMV